MQERPAVLLPPRSPVEFGFSNVNIISSPCGCVSGRLGMDAGVEWVEKLVWKWRQLVLAAATGIGGERQ